jgi:GTP cyclohydrolase I
MDHRPDNKMDFELTVFPTKVNQLIVVNNIEFSSLCAHHLLPFWGIAHVGYVPNTLAVGLSKIPRVVDHFAAQPQMQERLTADIASFLKKKLTAQGVAVVIIAKHTCMACRGVRKHNGHMTTSEMRGVFITGAAARAEFLQLINTNVTL